MNRRYQKGDNNNSLKDRAIVRTATRPLRQELDEAGYGDAQRWKHGRRSISRWDKHQRFSATSEAESPDLWKFVHLLRQLELAQDKAEDALTWLAEYGWRGVQKWSEIERPMREVLGS